VNCGRLDSGEEQSDPDAGLQRDLKINWLQKSMRREYDNRDSSLHKTEMETQIQVHHETRKNVLSSVQDVETAQRWNKATRIAFRFCFAYFLLYTSHFFPRYIPFAGNFINEQEVAFWRAVVPWVGKHILRLSDVPIIRSTGSGDTAFHYVQVFSFVLIAALVTLVWSLFDRKRLSYPKLYEWLKLVVRLWLASLMIRYGVVKVVPVQMIPPQLIQLVQQYGDFSPMGMLWTFMGSSTAYTIITGSVELLAGLLLILPRTTLLGSLLTVVAMTQVLILNMCYDVPGKLFSFHILLGAVFLLFAHFRRLTNLFIFNRQVEPSQNVALFRRKRLNYAALAFQIIFGLYVVGSNFSEARQEYERYYLSPNPPLYGIYTVEEYSVNGEMRPPLATDATRWKRIIFDRDNLFYIEPMVGENLSFLIQADEEKKIFTLTKRRVKNWKAEMSFVEPEPGHVLIEGQLDNQQYKAKLVRLDESKFLLLSRGFHWIQDYPVNR
jgi:uncharacterized membrane protein YphA (DoxX/SURF4 family)